MTLLSELVEFERLTARKRRHLANTAPSQHVRLQVAKDAFRNKEDALERIIVYHNTLATTDVVPETPQLVSLKERISQAENGLRETSYFREGLLGQVMKNLKLDLHVPAQTLKL
jgi:hypothetical protein